MANGWPPSRHHNARIRQLPQVDLERLREPLKVTDIDAFRASPAGTPADRLVYVPENREAGAVLVDRFQQTRPVHLQPSGDDVVPQPRNVRWDVGAQHVDRADRLDCPDEVVSGTDQ